MQEAVQRLALEGGVGAGLVRRVAVHRPAMQLALHLGRGGAVGRAALCGASLQSV